MPIKYTPPEVEIKAPEVDPVAVEFARNSDRQNGLVARQNAIMEELRIALEKSGNKVIEATVHRGDDKMIKSITMSVTSTP